MTTRGGHPARTSARDALEIHDPRPERVGIAALTVSVSAEGHRNPSLDGGGLLRVVGGRLVGSPPSTSRASRPDTRGTGIGHDRSRVCPLPEERPNALQAVAALGLRLSCRAATEPDAFAGLDHVMPWKADIVGIVMDGAASTGSARQSLSRRATPPAGLATRWRAGASSSTDPFGNRSGSRQAERHPTAGALTTTR